MASGLSVPEDVVPAAQEALGGGQLAVGAWQMWRGRHPSTPACGQIRDRIFAQPVRDEGRKPSRENVTNCSIQPGFADGSRFCGPEPACRKGPCLLHPRLPSHPHRARADGADGEQQRREYHSLFRGAVGNKRHSGAPGGLFTQECRPGRYIQPINAASCAQEPLSVQRCDKHIRPEPPPAWSLA